MARTEQRELELTAVFRKVPEGYIGFFEELPGAEAIGLVLQANRELAAREPDDHEVIREPIRVPAG